MKRCDYAGHEFVEREPVDKGVVELVCANCDEYKVAARVTTTPESE